MPPSSRQLGKVKVTKIGVIPIFSFSVGIVVGSRPRIDGLRFISTDRYHSAKLMEALMSGTAVDADVDVKGFKLKIHASTRQPLLVRRRPRGSRSSIGRSRRSHARIDDGSGGGGGGGGGSWDDGGGQPG